MSNENGQEWPKYKCHKIVEALKIQKAKHFEKQNRMELHFEDFEPIYMDIDTSARFKFKDADGNVDAGYYVVYEGGYVSWSPTKAFEDGYTRL